MVDLADLADQIARRGQLFDHDLLCLVRVLAHDVGVRVQVDVGRGVGKDATVAADDHPHVERELAPPGDVGGVAERADHRDAGALVGLRQLVGAHLDFLAVERNLHGGAEVRLEALVVGVRHERDAGGEQFGTRGVDLDRTRSVGLRECDLVVRPRPILVDDLGLGHSSAEVDVPQGRRFLGVRLAACDVAQEGALADAAAALVDRGVLQRPVDAQAEPTEEPLEQFLVDLDEFVAQFEEVRP